MSEKKKNDILRKLIAYNTMLSGYIYSLAEDWAVVEEALQETAVYMCEHWKDFTPGTDFGAWARTVAHNRCREVLHREGRQDRIRESILRHIPDSVWEEYSVYPAEKKQALTECIQGFGKKSREIIRLRYEEGKSCTSISRIAKKSVDAIYMALSRIRQALKKCVEEKLSGDTA